MEATEALSRIAPPATTTLPSATPWPTRRESSHGLLLLILTSACAQLDVAIVPYLVPYIQRDLHVSDVQLSLLIGVSFALFYTVIGIPAARLIDRHSRKLVLACGMLAWTIGATLCGLAQNFAQLFVARFIVGGGEALNGPTSYSLLGDLYPRDRMPRAIALYHIGSVAGPAVAMLMSAMLMKLVIDMPPVALPFGQMHGWQIIFIATAAPGFLIAGAMLATMREPGRRVIRNQIDASALGPASWIGDYVVALRYMAQHARVFAPIFLTLLVGALSFGSIGWMPTFYKRSFGWAPAQLAIYQSFLSLCLVPLGMVISVVLAERFNRQGRDDSPALVLILSRIIALAGMFVVLMPSPYLALALSAFSSVALGMSGPIQNVQMQIVTPAELRGKITALYLFLLNVIGVALSPVLVAMLTQYVFRDPMQIRWSLFVMACIATPGSLFFACLGRRPFAEEVRRLKALEAIHT